MSKSLSSDEENDSFVSHIKLFQVKCDTYQENKVGFQEDSIVQLFLDLSLPLTKNPKLFKILARENWSKCVTDLLKSISEEGNWDLFDKICLFIINFTDKSELLCESLVKVGLPDVLIDVSLKIYDKKIHLIDNKEFLNKINNIVHNIAHHVHLQQYFLQHPQIYRFKQIVSPLCLDTNDDVSIAATFVLIWLAKEDEEDLKMVDQQIIIIKKIYRYINNAFLTEERTVTGWSMCELLEGLHALSSFDTIKDNIIMLEEFVLTLIKIMTSPLSSEKEVEFSLGILWNLSFVEANRLILSTEYNIEAIVEPLTRSDCETIRNNANGLLWDLKKRSKKCLGVEKVNYDIFLSYSHAQKDLVFEIEKRLRKEFTVWIDKENIKGSSLDDMASGIERSKTFVMCVSNSYKQSQFCRSEANYAYQKKKPIIPLLMEHKYKPDGWLGILISSELYIDVSDLSKLAENMTKLKSTLKYKIEINCTTCDNSVEIGPTLEQTKNIKEWNQREVSEWLATNGLSHIQSKFEGFDGEMIGAIVKMKVECPLTYYESLERKMTLTFPEILKFSSILSKLN